MEQANGFSPVCILSCKRNAAGEPNHFPQNLHWCFLTDGASAISSFAYGIDSMLPAENVTNKYQYLFLTLIIMLIGKIISLHQLLCKHYIHSGPVVIVWSVNVLNKGCLRWSVSLYDAS